MMEQAIAILVGGLCGFWVDIKFLGFVMAYARANNLQWNEGYLSQIIAAITGAYLFTQWFC